MIYNMKDGEINSDSEYDPVNAVTAKQEYVNFKMRAW